MPFGDLELVEVEEVYNYLRKTGFLDDSGGNVSDGGDNSLQGTNASAAVGSLTLQNNSNNGVTGYFQGGHCVRLFIIYKYIRYYFIQLTP